MKKQKLDNANNTIIDHLKDIIKLFVVFLVSESKLDNMFLSNQFGISGYKIFRLYGNCFVRGLILYINENIRCKQLQEHVHLLNCEVVAIEFYQNNQKCLLLGLYKPPNQKTSDFIQTVSLILDLFLKIYDKVTLIGDFNLSSDAPGESFLQAYNLTSLIKEATCFQSGNPSCIDPILTNNKIMYKLFNPYETEISDHHKLISTIAKFQRMAATKKLVKLSDILSRLESNSYREFEKTFLVVLNKQAPLKIKFLRHNNNPIMTKELRRAIMKRSQLKSR